MARYLRDVLAPGTARERTSAWNRRPIVAAPLTLPRAGITA